MFNFIKSVILWLFVKKNRDIGIRYTKMALDIATEISKITKTKKDDLAIAYLTEKFVSGASVLGINNLKEAAETITKAQGSIKGVEIGVDSKEGVSLKLGRTKAEYNFKDKSVQVGTTIRF